MKTTTLNPIATPWIGISKSNTLNPMAVEWIPHANMLLTEEKLVAQSRFIGAGRKELGYYKPFRILQKKSSSAANLT